MLVFFGFLLIFGLLIAFKGRFISNKILLVTNSGYYIPKESSIHTFKQLQVNEGSGEYWIYGEDDKNYYYAGEGVEGVGEVYVLISKEQTQNCPDFKVLDYGTWQNCQ